MNNEFKLNVEEQEDTINHLKVHFDIDGEDKVQEITAAWTRMKNNRSVCVTCNKTFAMQKKWVEETYPGRRHIVWN